MSDGAHFHLHGTVNKQKFRYSSAAIRHEIQSNVAVCCAVWSRGVIGPYYFEDEDGQAITVTSQSFTEIINEFLAPKLPPNHNLWCHKLAPQPTWQ
jgi:hypothetical protein